MAMDEESYWVSPDGWSEGQSDDSLPDRFLKLKRGSLCAGMTDWVVGECCDPNERRFGLPDELGYLGKQLVKSLVSVDEKVFEKRGMSGSEIFWEVNRENQVGWLVELTTSVYFPGGDIEEWDVVLGRGLGVVKEKLVGEANIEVRSIEVKRNDQTDQSLMLLVRKVNGGWVRAEVTVWSGKKKIEKGYDFPDGEKGRGRKRKRKRG